MNKAVIESDAMLAAGAMLTEGKRMSPRELWGGRPAKKMRDLTDEAIAAMRMGTAHYVENAKAHAAAGAGCGDVGRGARGTRLSLTPIVIASEAKQSRD